MLAIAPDSERNVWLSYAEEQSVQLCEQNEQLMQFADYEDFIM